MKNGGVHITRDGSNLSFILNPRSRGYFRGFRDIAAARWPQAKFYFSSEEKELHTIGRKAAEGHGGRRPVLVACGGDGTFRAVATAAGDNAILGIIPMGTVNLVAYQLGIPPNIRAALDFLETAQPVHIYPGCCSWSGSDIRQLFFLSVSMGPDADAVHYVSKNLKALLGGFAYAVSFLGRLLLNPLPRVSYRLEGRQSFSNGIIVVSSGCYGGRHPLSTPQSLYRPGIGIISIHPGKKNIFGFFLALFLRIGRWSDHASLLDGSGLEISCPPHGRFQIDGDKLSASMISIRSMDTPLTVIANPSLIKR